MDRGPRGSGLYTVLGHAFLTPLLAWPLFSHPTSSVAPRFAPLKRCAAASVVRSCPSPVGRAQHLCNTTLYNFPLRARRTGFSQRVGAPTSDPSLCPGPMLQGVSYVHHANKYIRNTIPDDVGIPSSVSLAYRGGAMRYVSISASQHATPFGLRLSARALLGGAILHLRRDDRGSFP